MNIISGCFHRGITNIIEQVKENFNKPINLLLGGFHTFDNICLLCSENEVEYCHRKIVAEYFKKKLGKIAIIHL